MLTFKVDEIGSWGQRKEPERFTPVFTIDDLHWQGFDQYDLTNVPAQYRENVRWGIYLGESRVLIASDPE